MQLNTIRKYDSQNEIRPGHAWKIGDTKKLFIRFIGYKDHVRSIGVSDLIDIQLNDLEQQIVLPNNLLG